MNNDNSKTILLIEDEAIIAMREKIELEKYGYIVHHITTGEKAVQSIIENKHSIDLILMDIDLGSGIDGTQVAKQILNHKDIPIVFLSSHTEPEIVEKTEKISSYGYVVKNSGIVVLDTSIKMAFKLYEINKKLSNELAERKRAEEEKKQAQNQYKILVKNIPGIVFHCKPSDSWNMLYMSDDVYALTGYPKSDFIQNSVRTYESVIYIKDRNYVSESVYSAIDTDRQWDIEYRILHKDGSIRWMHEKGRGISESDGKDTYLAGIIIDITERKQAEEEIQRQLSEKETLLKEVHHRIKNNITSIEGLLSLQADSSDNDEVKNALQESISRIQSTRVLYEKLLISNGYRDVSIKNYIDSLIDSLLAVFPESKNISIKKTIIDIIVSSKKAMLIGIIINELLTNIFKYAFKEIEKGHILIEVNKTENNVTLKVKDNGIGIDTRVDANKSQGFGLILIKMMAEQLKGAFTMENDNGIRSVLKFEI